MDLLDAVILGIVEGITEYLPVSSTGHLIITSWLLGLSEEYRTKVAVDAFNIIIQGGAILAVLGLYRSRVWQMIRGLLGRDPVGRRLFVNLVIAFIPAAILGVLFDDLITRHLFYPYPVLAALFLGGLVLLGIGPWQRRIFRAQEPADPDPGQTKEASRRFTELESLRWTQALTIGLLQCVAMWPGTSRSMMTIVGGMFMGLRPRQAAEFSFLLGLPTLGGACVYKLLKIGLAEKSTFIQDLGGWMPLVVGLVVATAAAALAVHWLVSWLGTHGLGIFGWWRIGLSGLLLAGILSGRLNINPPPNLENVNPKTLVEPSKRVTMTPAGFAAPSASRVHRTTE
ncbi:MAG: undecaprenyl-diphosphate phosphatase [Planctomycetota bacterium]|nr:undecaprenyl-diphosphate phosphatase [Planctomycetota bacterium]